MNEIDDFGQLDFACLLNEDQGNDLSLGSIDTGQPTTQVSQGHMTINNMDMGCLMMTYAAKQ
jgi:hypothetical protein